MKFHIDRKQAVSAARKAAPENSPIAELTGVLVEVDENTGQAVTCDGARLIETREKAKTEDAAKERPKKKTSKTKKAAAKAA